MNGASLLNPHTERSIAVGADGVLAAQIDSPIAFQNLYSLYASRLYKSIFRITKNAQDAEDALQDTFLRAYLAIYTFEGKSSIYSWLTRIAINAALTILRRQRVRPEILFDPQPNGVVQKGSSTTLVVRYQDGAKTISVPANVTVVAVVPGEVQLAAGETAYAKTDKQADGTLTTHMILVIGGPPSGNSK
jgi:RNA polymerase sigma factor (sigma-70 family)